MTVSIVISVYNEERHLAECIESCLNQTYKDVEIIAVNDGSTDRSQDILERYSDRIRIVTKKNGGIASAHNAGIKNMKGKWFKKVDGDDTLHPDAVERLVLATERINDYNTIVYMNGQLLHEDGRITVGDGYLDNTTSPFEQAVRLLCLDHFGYFATALVHKSVFEKVGMFDENLHIQEEYEMALRMCMNGIRFHYVADKIYTYRIHAAQTTRKHDIPRATRAIRNRMLAEMDGDTHRRYTNGMKAYIRRQSFSSGVWRYANLYRPAEESTLMRGRVVSMCARNPLLRAGYRTARFFAESTKLQDYSRMRGWFWAMRHASSDEVARARRQIEPEFLPRRVYDTNSTTEPGQMT